MKEALVYILLGVGLAGLFGVIDVYTEKAYPSSIKHIVIVDTGLDLSDDRFKHLCLIGHKDFTHTGINDYNNHGTHITGIIEQNVHRDDYCYIIVKYWDQKTSDKQNAEHSVQAMNYAASLNPEIINYSSVGQNYILSEYAVIKNHPKIIFNVAAGNDNVNLDESPRYPCSYNLPNIHCVGKIGGIRKFSNYGKSVKFLEIGEDILSFLPQHRTGYMSGTSMSTAIQSARILNEL